MLSRFAIITFVFLGLVLVVPQAASAQEILNFSVSTNAADAVDANIGDGICLTVNATCTLRAAVQEANAAPTKRAFIQVNNAGTIALTIDGANENAASIGDLDVTGNVHISNGAIINASALDDRAFHVHSGGRLIIADSDVTGGNTVSGQNGGGVFVTGVGSILELQFMTVKTSVAVAGRGGGVSIENGASALIEQVSIDGNGAGLEGGGIYVSNAGLELFNTTVIANATSNNGKGAGLAINNDSDDNTIDDELKYVNINNATFHSNIIATGGTGGGIANLNDIAPTLNNTILTANSATTGPQCGFAAPATAAVVSFGFNIITSHTGCTGASGVDSTTVPTLTLFTGSNGRHYKPTNTSSSAVDAASALACRSTDAVGNPRPQGSGCDIGAVELAVGFFGTISSTPSVALNQELTVTVSDFDQRFFGSVSVSAELRLNTLVADSETLTLEETDIDGVFSGTFPVQFNSVATPNDGIFTTFGEGRITFTYVDSPNGATEGGISNRTAITQIRGLESDLITNPSFEADADLNKIPDGWTPASLSGDKRKCNTPQKTFAIDGVCAFIMANPVGALSQKIPLPLPSGLDEDLYLEVLVNTLASRPGLIASIKIKGVGGEVEKCSINLLAGTNSGAGGYESYQCNIESDEVDVIQSIKVMISTPSGAKVTYDRVSLLAFNPRERGADAAAGETSVRGDVLPLPVAPDGFRR